jgi:hypothetical protein
LISTAPRSVGRFRSNDRPSDRHRDGLRPAQRLGAPRHADRGDATPETRRRLDGVRREHVDDQPVTFIAKAVAVQVRIRQLEAVGARSTEASPAAGPDRARRCPASGERP